MDMPDIPERHHRRTIRYAQYDYSRPGFYFVTIATFERDCIFGYIIRSEMQLTLAGQCAQAVLLALPTNFPVQIDSWVIMPNHLHAILQLLDLSVGAKHPATASIETGCETSGCFAPSPSTTASKPHGTKPGSLGAVVQNYKSLTTRRINVARNTPSAPVWQRNYYERIIRDEKELMQTRAYILDNPCKWEEDTEFKR